MMMDYPLTLIPILERAGRLFGKVEIVSRLDEDSLHRYCYTDFYPRARALAAALQKAGLKRGDRVATLMGNHYAHLEAYFGIPVASGVLHTLNLRLHPRDLAYIVNHAQDRFLIVDDALLPLFEKFRESVSLERVIVVSLSGPKPPGAEEDYESFLGSGGDKFSYPELKEDEPAALCYTSGTTGRPKGVLYSHRALVLGAFALSLVDSLAISHHDVILPVVPLFHAAAWGVPYAATMVGAKQIFFGAHLDPETLLELFEKEQVTFSNGVPTVWIRMLEALESHPGRWKLAPGFRLAVAGSAAPESMIRGFERHGVRVVHGWGMTEIPPMCTLSQPKSTMRELTDDETYALRAKQGLPGPFLDFRAMGESGEVPWDGKTMGELQARGPWVAAAYYNLPEKQDRWTADGWFATGDVVTIDPEGYIKIVDRTKDLINSGGEWISSLDLENALTSHPAIQEAAVIAVPHPEWQERPLALLVSNGDPRPSPEELREYLEQQFAHWQVPDAFLFRDEILRTSTGKFWKAKLREEYSNWKWKP